MCVGIFILARTFIEKGEKVVGLTFTDQSCYSWCTRDDLKKRFIWNTFIQAWRKMCLQLENPLGLNTQNCLILSSGRNRKPSNL